ncbi:MAG TPA: DUF2007 domain-containing protein [Acidobacteriota bacterium]|jgi:hypothetical protein|nr:DUF2007 domain-containing protein [Acidobacteriota bacterium]
MAPASKTNDEETVLLTVVYNDVEANLIRTILDEAGIHCLLVTQVPRSVYPFTINGLGEIRIRVLASQLDKARELVAESRKQQPDDDVEDTE